MGATNPTPVLSLVRQDTLRTSEAGSLTYAAATPFVDKAFDEIRLVDLKGEPCAWPRPDYTNRDIDHELLSGALTSTQRLIATEIELGVDYIGSDVRARIKRWMQDRATVLVSPGYGRQTELAWRACTTPLTTDLTGRWALTNTMAAATGYVWDAFMPGRQAVMRLFAGLTAKRVATPFGAGQVFDSGAANLFATGTSPPGSYPIGSSEADSGWGSWGAWATDITREYLSGAFGVTGYAGALRVTSATRRTGDGVNARVLGRVLPATITGSGSVWVGVWLKGRGGSGFTAAVGWDGGASKTVSLAGTDLSEWTFVRLGCYGTPWPANSTQWVKLDLTPALGMADDFDLLVGPIVCNFQADTTGMAQAFPNWIPSTRPTGDMLGVTSFVLPRAGTLLASLYVPPWWSYDSNTPWACPILWPTAGTGGNTYLRGGPSRWPYIQLLHFWGGGGSDYVSANVNPSAFAPGSVVSVAVTWSSDATRLYVNGALVATRAGCPTMRTAATSFSMFGSSAYSAGGLVPLSLRVDNEVLSAGHLADLHRTASDVATAGVLAATRGRAYRITAIPSTARNQDGGTVWIGPLKLRQVSYTEALSDITTKEP